MVRLLDALTRGRSPGMLCRELHLQHHPSIKRFAKGDWDPIHGKVIYHNDVLTLYARKRPAISHSKLPPPPPTTPGAPNPSAPIPRAPTPGAQTPGAPSPGAPTPGAAQPCTPMCGPGYPPPSAEGLPDPAPPAEFAFDADESQAGEGLALGIIPVLPSGLDVIPGISAYALFRQAAAVAFFHERIRYFESLPERFVYSLRVGGDLNCVKRLSAMLAPSMQTEHAAGGSLGVWSGEADFLCSAPTDMQGHKEDVAEALINKHLWFSVSCQRPHRQKWRPRANFQVSLWAFRS